jgi:CysZ protein
MNIFKKMALFKNFSVGINTYGDAHKVIVKHRLWWYVFLPGFIHLLLFAIIFGLGWIYSGRISYWLMDLLGLNSEPSGYLKYLIIFIRFILNFLFQFIVILIYISCYKYIILMIMSPILAILSEKIEKVTTGKEYPFKFKQLIKDIIRGNILVIRNISIELIWTVILFFAGYIPILGFFSPVVLITISFYFFGFSMIDYSSERHKLSRKESVRWVRANKGFAIANGCIFYLLLLIPIIGILVAPAYSIIAATLGVEKINNPLPQKITLKIT